MLEHILNVANITIKFIKNVKYYVKWFWIYDVYFLYNLACCVLGMSSDLSF